MKQEQSSFKKGEEEFRKITRNTDKDIGAVTQAIKVALVDHQEKMLRLFRLKCLCRIRGLETDIGVKSNQPSLLFYQGALQEYNKLHYHLSDIKWIVADVDCAIKYLSDEERAEFEKLKKEMK